MRVLIVSAAFPPQPGGVATHVNDLAHGLVHGGHDVFVQAASADEHHATDGHGRLKIWKQAKSSVWEFDGRRVFAESVLQRLLDRWHEIQPDLIHAHDFDSLFVAWNLKVAYGCPVVATIHRAPSPWRDFRFRENPKDCFLEVLRRGKVLDRLVVPSRASASVLRKQGFLAPSQVSGVAVIPHGISPFLRGVEENPVLVEELRLEEPNRVLVLCPGRADEHKDLDTLLEAASLVKKEEKALGIGGTTFHLCCGREDPFFSRVESLAVARGLHEGDSIFFRKLKYKEMATVYRHAKVAVITSRHEAFGLAILESFLFDVPVVAANTTAVGEIISNGRNGLLYTDGDPSDLARQLLRTLRDDSLRSQVAEEGKRELREGGKFTLRRMVSAYEELYAKLV